MDNIIDKIKNLMAKNVASGCSVAEAETASKLAQKLISQYRINLADLEDNISNENHLSNIHKHDFDEAISARIAQWKIDLAGSICIANDCKFLILRVNQEGSTNKANKLIFIGFNSDAEIIKYLYAYLTALTEVVCENELKKHSFSRGQGKSWANSFKLGMAHSIGNRLIQAAKEAKDEVQVSNSTAIVKLENKACLVKDKVNEMFNNIQSKNYKSNVKSETAYYKGVAAGSSANINGRVLR